MRGGVVMFGAPNGVVWIQTGNAEKVCSTTNTVRVEEWMLHERAKFLNVITAWASGVVAIDLVQRHA